MGFSGFFYLWREMQTASSRFRTRVTDSVSYNDNCYTKSATILLIHMRTINQERWHYFFSILGA